MNINVKIFCDCGEELDHVDTNYTKDGVEMIVKPCETCLEKNGKENCQRGHEAGYDEGLNSVGG